VEFFWDEVMKRGKRDDVPPFLVSPKYYMASIYRDGIYLLALMTGEMQSLFVLEFLHRVFDVYVSYFGNVNARSITDNFSTAYQLLEEMLDNVSIQIARINVCDLLLQSSNPRFSFHFVILPSYGNSSTLIFLFNRDTQ
jgi:hypothetical protein